MKLMLKMGIRRLAEAEATFQLRERERERGGGGGGGGKQRWTIRWKGKRLIILQQYN